MCVCVCVQLTLLAVSAVSEKTLIQLSLTAIYVPVFGVRRLTLPVTVLTLCYGRCVINWN